MGAIHRGQVQVGQNIAVDRQKRPAPQNFPQSPQAAAGAQNLRLRADAELEAPGPAGQELLHLRRQMVGVHRHLQKPGRLHLRQQQPQQGPIQDGNQGLGHQIGQWPEPGPQPRRQDGCLHYRIRFLIFGFRFSVKAWFIVREPFFLWIINKITAGKRISSLKLETWNLELII